MSGGVVGYPVSARFCMCCGFSSDNPHLFKRASTEAPHGIAVTRDDWICLSWRACSERGDAS